jgi:hypothetical protein
LGNWNAKRGVKGRQGTQKRKRRKAMGSIYQRGNTLWIKYYRNGKPYRESSHSDKQTAAKRLLRLREGQIVEGKFPGLNAEKTTFKELAKDYLTYYEVNGLKSYFRADISARHLEDFFKDYLTYAITSVTRDSARYS